VKDAFGIDAEDEVELFFGDRTERRAVTDAGVGDNGVEMAVAGDQLVVHRLHCIELGHVGHKT
jgi:hypothetical protein